MRGKNFLNLDIGLPVQSLRQSIRACLALETTHQETMVDAVNRRGRGIRCKVSCTPLTTQGQGTHGAILVMEELPVAG